MTKNLKALKISNIGQNVEQGQYLYTIGGRFNWFINFGKLCQRLPKLNTGMFHDPEIPLLGT